MGSSIVVLVLVALLSFILLLLADHYYNDVEHLGKMTFTMLAFAFTTSYFLIKAIPKAVHWIT